jgi:hypothetical protein
MSYMTMAKEIVGDIPGIALPKAQTLLKEALALIYDEQRWSFQIAEGGWMAPGIYGRQNLPGQDFLISPGLISVEPFSTIVHGDLAATLAWATTRRHRPFITEQQIRVPQYGLYHIVNYYPPGEDPEDPDSHTATLHLDRPWMDPEQKHAHYMIYQAYFPVPEGFRGFGTITDMTFNASLDFWCHDQAWLNERDPQRLNFDMPRHAIPYQIDQRPGSAFRGQMLYELWPHPLARMPYSFTYRFAGPPLKKPDDTVPFPLNEELVKFRARELGALWKESQLNDGLDRGSGADWRFLAQSFQAEYGARLKTVKLLDMQLGDQYWSKFDCRCRGRAEEDWNVGGIAVLPCAEGPVGPEPPPEPPEPPVEVAVIFGGVGQPGAGASVVAVEGNAVLTTGDTLSSIGDAAESVGDTFGPFVPSNQAIYLLLMAGDHTFVDANTGFPFVFNAPLAVSFLPTGAINPVAMFLYASTHALWGSFRPMIAS